MDESQKKPLWWQYGIIYQIYPRSFQDSNGDGIGDLRGIIGRLDYLKGLGVTALWISPIYPSPMADFGYDISDYCGIWPGFGTMTDFDDLLRELHAAGMKLILDLVPNHSSDRHPWFLESRSSRDNPKRDWYIWKDGRPDGNPPNNWLSVFGGSAWDWDEKTGQFYYHGFLKEQPDLNWRNPDVEAAMLDIMRFWLDKGVDGFRVDAMWHMIKDLHFRDNPLNPDYTEYMPTYDRLLPVYSTDQPEMHEIAARMRRLLDGYKERLLIAEVYLPVSRLVDYYGVNNAEAHLPFNFILIAITWDPNVIAAAVNEYEKALPGNAWPNWVMGNHDKSRVCSRIGRQQAKLAAMLLLTLRGTPTIYYGEEIGMEDVPIPFQEVQDPQGLNMPDKNLSRDPERTPMQWDASRNSGFSEAKPWLRLPRSFARNNVKIQEDDPYSFLCLYKRLIKLRQAEPSLTIGRYMPVFSDRQMIAYIRHAPGHDAFLILLNLSHRPCYFTARNAIFKGTVEINTLAEEEGRSLPGVVALSGDEGLIARLEQGDLRTA